VNEIERIIRRMSPEELAAWMAIGGWLPKGQLAARFEAEALRRDTLAEAVATESQRPNPGVRQDAQPLEPAQYAASFCRMSAA
jgi:hypothetical protein